LASLDNWLKDRATVVEHLEELAIDSATLKQQVEAIQVSYQYHVICTMFVMLMHKSTVYTYEKVQRVYWMHWTGLVFLGLATAFTSTHLPFYNYVT